MGILALCVEHDTFISKSLSKQFQIEIQRYGENSGLFSYENMIFLAMTNTVFNDAYRKVRKTLPEHQQEDFETYKAYAQVASRNYRVWDEVRFSTDIHTQMKPVFPQFRGIRHENKLLEVIRNHVSLIHALPIIEMNKIDLSRYKWKSLMSLVWIFFSVVYTDFFFSWNSKSVVSVLHISRNWICR